MHKYIHRHIEHLLSENLAVFPAVVVLGPRQCGKSTVVKTNCILQYTGTLLQN